MNLIKYFVALAILPLFFSCTPDGRPAAAFEADTTAGQSDLAVQFTDTSNAGASPITQWSWDFGDGNTSTLQHPTHLYKQDGYKTVQLTVTNEAGAGSNVKTDYIFIGNVWSRVVGTPGEDIARAVARTSNNGVVIAGTVLADTGDKDILVERYNPDGALAWSAAFGGEGDDDAGGIVVVNDGDIIVCGTTRSFGAGGSDVFLFRLDPSGNVRWSKTYGGLSDETGRALAATTDGGFIVAGEASPSGAAFPEAHFVKTNGNGDQTWAKFVATQEPDEVRGIVPVDGGYAFSGSTGSVNVQIYVGKIDADGNKVWTATAGDGGEDRGGQIVVAGDGGDLLVVGTRTATSATGADMAMVRFDKDGMVKTSHTFGGGGQQQGRSIVAIGNDVVLTGTATTNERGIDVYLVRAGKDGTLQWSALLGGTATDAGNAVTGLNGGLAVVGATQSYGAGEFDMYLLRTNNEGRVPEVPAAPLR